MYKVETALLPAESLVALVVVSPPFPSPPIGVVMPPPTNDCHYHARLLTCRGVFLRAPLNLSYHYSLGRYTHYRPTQIMFKRGLLVRSVAYCLVSKPYISSDLSGKLLCLQSILNDLDRLLDKSYLFHIAIPCCIQPACCKDQSSTNDFLSEKKLYSMHDWYWESILY